MTALQDANTKFFHARVNSRRSKIFIFKLRCNHGWVKSHAEKQGVVHNHFSAAIGRGDPSSLNFNWDSLNLPVPNLEGIDDVFSEAEVKAAIMALPSDKAPGSDGFTDKLFKACWETIKGDIMAAINRFADLHKNNLKRLNSANIVLIPKKEGAEDIIDYRPISLIHAFDKIVAKILLLRLTPRMNDLVSIGQTVFIKKISIHDNFIFVSTPALLFELDIKKSF